MSSPSRATHSLVAQRIPINCPKPLDPRVACPLAPGRLPHGPSAKAGEGATLCRAMLLADLYRCAAPRGQLADILGSMRS